MIEEQRELKGRLQNISNELGTAEAEFSYLSVKIKPSSTRSQKHDVLIQALDRIRNCELLVIDDLGVENEDKKSLEVAFRVIDARVKANRPMIITSNLNGQDLMTDEMKYKRIYDRIKDVCKPVVFKGKSRRGRKNHADKWEEVDRILDGAAQVPTIWIFFRERIQSRRKRLQGWGRL